LADLNPNSTLPAVRMQDDLNIEIAGALSEGEDKDGAAPPPKTGWEEVVEILEAFLLAIVAIATAWSGYQAARWDGHEAELYGQASTIRVRADQLLTLGGQQRLLDVTTFNTWIEARFEERTELTALYERRFSPEYKVAFDAWLATDPFSNPPGAARAQLHARVRQPPARAGGGDERTVVPHVRRGDDREEPRRRLHPDDRDACDGCCS
jgi:hypothetical protein